MPKFNIIVHPPKAIEGKNWRQLTIEWPVVPSKGQTIFLGPKGCDGVCVRVTDVNHWLGVDDIDVHCFIVGERDPVEAFNSLVKEDGWQ